MNLVHARDLALARHIGVDFQDCRPAAEGVREHWRSWPVRLASIRALAQRRGVKSVRMRADLRGAHVGAAGRPQSLAHRVRRDRRPAARQEAQAPSHWRPSRSLRLRSCARRAGMSGRHRSSVTDSSTTSRAAPSTNGFEITNTGMPAGWSARSTKGNRAMIFGASGGASFVHQAPAPGPPSTANMPRSPTESRDRADHLAGPEMRHAGRREAEVKTRRIPHRGVAARTRRHERCRAPEHR